MNCSKCGAELQPGQAFCSNCGQPVEQQPQMNQQPAQPEMNQQMNQQPAQPEMNQQMYQQPVQSGMNQQYGQPGINPQPYQPNYGAPAQPMKWYKFISYVQLPLSALSFLMLAVQLLTGAHYQGQADLVYAFFSSLKTVDIIFGLLYLVFTVAAVLICVKMNKRTKDAVKWYLIYLGASVVVSVLYIILVYMTTQVFTEADSIIPTIVVSVVMIVVNKIYFDKRKDYFVN